MIHFTKLLLTGLSVVCCLLFSSIGSVVYGGATGGKYFDFSPRAVQAYNFAISTRLEESRQLVATMKKEEPDNLIAEFIENYIEFLTIYLDEDEASFKRLRNASDGRLYRLSKGDMNSPYYLYTQAEVRLQWAILRGRFGEYLTSISEVKQAYALLEENQKKHPNFVPNKKSLGIMHTLIGVIPEEYRWAIKMFGGIEGSMAQGLAELESVLKYAETNDFLFEKETITAYSFLLLHLGNKGERAWEVINHPKLKNLNNPLVNIAIANVAIRTGRNDAAINVLEKMPTGKEYHTLYYRDYMLGLAKMYRLDADANKYLEEFVNRYPGKFFIKESYQKLAWYHLVNNNRSGYDMYIKYAKIKGGNRFEPDKAAEKEATSGEVPDALLTKARLLFDGGYNTKAYDLLKNNASTYLGGDKKSLEYLYRMGRITHKLKKTTEATNYYTQTIEKGAEKPWFFACNAALQLGMLHEEKHDKLKATAAYKQCLSLQPEEYAASLHAKAKAGLGRVKN